MKRFAIFLIVLALAVRAAVPAGWMPDKQSFQLTLCTGIDTQTVWMDSKGKLHKQKPHSGDEQKQQPCAFGALAAMSGPAAFGQTSEPIAPVSSERILASSTTIGQGLAAPPPPQTGPPILI